jgi:hypothetical protein
MCWVEMSLPGPILVVSDRHDRRLPAALSAAGAFPILECTLAEAAAAIGRVKPAAVLLADPGPHAAAVQNPADGLIDAIDAAPAPFMPVVARVTHCGATILDVLPVNAAASIDQVVARLACALRVRTLHATVLRRIETLRRNGAAVPALPASDPLEEATILVAGRGRTYPPLAMAVGERLGAPGLIGALSVENAARHLNTRDVDGIILGDGFGPTTTQAFLTALMEDSRFRDLPVGVVPDIPPALDRARLFGLEPVGGAPEDIVAHLLPLVRVHAFGMRLRRHVAALDARGLIDPQTGLLTVAAFERKLPRAVTDARERGIAMSIARFRLPPGFGRRPRIDAARLVSRLIRAVDFACQEDDGAIIVVFAESALRHAHVITRRIAAVMRQTVLEPERSCLQAMVTLACLKAADTAQSLVERVCERTATAAE